MIRNKSSHSSASPLSSPASVHTVSREPSIAKEDLQGCRGWVVECATSHNRPRHALANGSANGLCTQGKCLLGGLEAWSPPASDSHLRSTRQVQTRMAPSSYKSYSGATAPSSTTVSIPLPALPCKLPVLLKDCEPSPLADKKLVPPLPFQEHCLGEDPAACFAYFLPSNLRPSSKLHRALHTLSQAFA